MGENPQTQPFLLQTTQIELLRTKLNLDIQYIQFVKHAHILGSMSYNFFRYTVTGFIFVTVYPHTYTCAQLPLYIFLSLQCHFLSAWKFTATTHIT